MEASMKILQNKIIALVATIFLILITSCSCSFDWLEKVGAEITLERGIKIATWNTQTFFDAVEEGTEFYEFIGEKSFWNLEKYGARVSRLCEVAEKIDADILVLQEIENEAVVQDLMNEMPYAMKYSFAAFAKEQGDAFGCAVLSRLPIESFKTHQLNSLLAKSAEQPRLRPLIEARIYTQNEDDPILTLFVCHWKSKVGGEEKTDFWRQAQEDLLMQHVKEAIKHSVVVATGDFNRTEEDFSSEFNSLFYNGWNSFYGETGSYVYEDNWERIDSIFLANNSTYRLVQFTPEDSGEHTSSTGKPRKYDVYSGEGYSDHLPLSAVVTIIE